MDTPPEMDILHDHSRYNLRIHNVCWIFNPKFKKLGTTNNSTIDYEKSFKNMCMAFCNNPVFHNAKKHTVSDSRRYCCFSKTKPQIILLTSTEGCKILFNPIKTSDIDSEKNWSNKQAIRFFCSIATKITWLWIKWWDMTVIKTCFCL